MYIHQNKLRKHECQPLEPCGWPTRCGYYAGIHGRTQPWVDNHVVSMDDEPIGPYKHPWNFIKKKVVEMSKPCRQTMYRPPKPWYPSILPPKKQNSLHKHQNKSVRPKSGFACSWIATNTHRLGMGIAPFDRACAIRRIGVQSYKRKKLLKVKKILKSVFPM